MLRFSMCAAALALAAAPAAAHHTFVTKYNSAKTIEVSGTVTSVSFTNPHMYFSITTGSTTWTVETESISVASAKGLKPTLLKAGAKVRVRGWPARDGSAAMGLNIITFQGGPSITTRGSAR